MPSTSTSKASPSAVTSLPTPMTFDHLHHQAAINHATSLPPRSQVLALGASIGQLCTQVISHAPLDQIPPPETDLSPTIDDVDTNTNTNTNQLPSSPFWSKPSPSRQIIYNAIGKVFFALVQLAQKTEINMQSSILKKMELNARKYPVHLCKGKSQKYTEYSEQTGITVHNQSLLDISLESDCNAISPLDEEVNDNDDGANDGDAENTPNNIPIPGSLLLPSTVSQMTAMIREFAMDRNWSRYHTPRNIVLAMMGELGELAEIFQFEGDKPDDAEKGVREWDEGKKDHLAQELADVSIYCLRLADVVGIPDLGLVACRMG